MGDNAGWDPEHIFAKNVNLIAPSFLPNPSRSFTHKLKGALDSLFLVSTLIYSGVCQEFMDFFFFFKFRDISKEAENSWCNQKLFGLNTF